jgi:hypothetical protein
LRTGSPLTTDAFYDVEVRVIQLSAAKFATISDLSLRIQPLFPSLFVRNRAAETTKFVMVSIDSSPLGSCVDRLREFATVPRLSGMSSAGRLLPSVDL